MVSFLKEYKGIDFLKEYKDILGKHKQGVHSYRILDVALTDYLMTIVGAFIISYYTDIPVVLTTIGLFTVGILLHIIFGVPTNTTRWLGLRL